MTSRTHLPVTSDAPSTARRIRVLLADDTPDIRLLLRMRLSLDERFVVVGEAADGAEAVRLAGSERPDVVVLDLAMPVMDGLQAIPEILARSPDTKILVLSGFDKTHMAATALSAGAHSYLEKGIAATTLPTKLAELCAVGREGDDPSPPTITESEKNAVASRARVRMDVAALHQMITSAVEQASELGSAFGAFCEAVRTTVPLDRGSFVVAEEEGFRIAAVGGPEHWRLPAGVTIPVMGSVARAIEEKRPFLVADTARDDGDGTNRVLLERGIRSYVSVPVIVAGHVEALVNFSSLKMDGFSPSDVPVLEGAVRRVAGVFHLLLLLEWEREGSRKLRELDRLKNELAGIVAHDLRSPMTVIRGFASTLRNRWDDLEGAERGEFLDAMVRNTDELVRLVDDMLDVAQIDSGELRCDLRPFDLGSLVEQVASEKALTEDRRCAVRVETELPRALGDEQRQRQILGNLLGNAFKYSAPEDPVDLTVDRDGRMLRVSVRDHGSGIVPDDLPMLFEKFSRAPQPDDRPAVKGTGLGLYVCKSLVEAQGGSIHVESTLEVGSIFTYTVPIADDAPGDGAGTDRLPIHLR